MRAQAAGTATPDLYDAADVATFSAQGQVIDLVLGLTTELFEVGGSSAVTERYRLDRHWRNARTLASHNPVIYRSTDRRRPRPQRHQPECGDRELLAGRAAAGGTG